MTINSRLILKNFLYMKPFILFGHSFLYEENEKILEVRDTAYLVI